MKKILIPNGSFHDIPLIKEAKKLGYYVITSGAAPKAVGHSYADRYVYGDFSDKVRMLQIAQEEDVDAICSNCNDFGYLSACYAAEKMGLPGHESYEKAVILHHKDAFKEFAKKWHLSTPAAMHFTEESTAMDWCCQAEYPLIVKPTDLGAGQGIHRVNDLLEAKAAIQDALQKSKNRAIVIEPFIEGTSHSFNAFIIGQRVASWYSDNEYMLFDPYRVSTSASPATGIEKALPVLLHDTNLVAEKLDLPDGLLHSQYIMDKEGNPHILEITRRMSGDWYPYPEMRATGIDWMRYIVMAQCGMDCSEFPSNVRQRGFTGRHCLNAPYPGKIKSFKVAPELEQYVYDRIIWGGEGFEVKKPEKDYPGILFLEFDNSVTEKMIVGRINQYISFTYE